MYFTGELDSLNSFLIIALFMREKQIGNKEFPQVVYNTTINNLRSIPSFRYEWRFSERKEVNLNPVRRVYGK